MYNCRIVAYDVNEQNKCIVFSLKKGKVTFSSYLARS